MKYQYKKRFNFKIFKMIITKNKNKKRLNKEDKQVFLKLIKLNSHKKNKI